MFSPSNQTFTNFYVEDGLQSNLFSALYTEAAAFKGKDGILYFGGINGLSAFDPAAIQKNPYVPPVVLTQFRLFDKPQPGKQEAEEIELRHHENFFSFEFAALNYTNPQKNQYAYQLEGVDRDWVYSGSRRLASYTDVAPGTYIFRVKGSNNDGVWNEQGTAIRLIIHPPWWQTMWAYSGYGLFFLFSLWGFVQYRSRQLVREKRILEHKVSVRTQELKEANQALNQQKEEIAHQRDQVAQTLTELQATQTQLVQREKMASLGELTAGIAHEIQNPLNFVNNFSEVSQELVCELREDLQAGRTQEATDITHDLEQNLQKIHHHGRRADAIVKNMLQHSRPTSGEKQLMDLNALTDEYLRLAYHGLRAKDKSFTCTLNTYFDQKLPLVEVVPQEIGRVLLNLYNNAFYAVQQKTKQVPVGAAWEEEAYFPTVSVSTHQWEGQVEIRVRDNGIGMPESLKSKIFQPFFTTKPTGSGTGLGLSLSYDIVTKGHGGQLHVESVEGEFSQFKVSLPLGGSPLNSPGDINLNIGNAPL